ncbi:hypothetical protein [Sphingomonas faeni]|uniref:hypothetical protein n=1 Tax=Sphingomonas faeni TaxID=185950 RepID=UPI00335460A1
MFLQARFLGLAVAKELQQGGAGHRCQHVGGQRVDLAGNDGEAVDDRLILPRRRARQPRQLPLELLGEQPSMILG